jgi:hypothetical protein
MYLRHLFIIYWRGSSISNMILIITIFRLFQEQNTALLEINLQRQVFGRTL